MRAVAPTVVRLVPVLDFCGVESIVVLQARLVDRARYDFRVCTFWKKGVVSISFRMATRSSSEETAP